MEALTRVSNRRWLMLEIFGISDSESCLAEVLGYYSCFVIMMDGRLDGTRYL